MEAPLRRLAPVRQGRAREQQRAPEQRAPEQRAPEQRALEQRALEQRALEQQRAPEQQRALESWEPRSGSSLVRQHSTRMKAELQATRQQPRPAHPA